MADEVFGARPCAAQRVTVVRRPPTPKRDVVDLTLSDSEDDDIGAATSLQAGRGAVAARRRNDNGRAGSRGRNEGMRGQGRRIDAASVLPNLPPASSAAMEADEDLARAIAMSLQSVQEAPKEKAVICLEDSDEEEGAELLGGLHAGSVLGKRPKATESAPLSERSQLLATQRSEYEEALWQDRQREQEKAELVAAEEAEGQKSRRLEQRRATLAARQLREACADDSSALSLSIRLPGKANGQAERRFAEDSTWADVKEWAATEVAKDESLPLEQMWWPEDFELALSYPLTVLS
eukprot:CAMPEP_0114617770 /NCGR_PEP_ID=MMETSP0168-20121206/7365_1 /TAXON_ID=95228 ORGANISM="Vannella sp., Strain DIVA3 517/6/12" /NCGR_SAMPLE_ID=MMETSP0168 /ASSEMBLY_ACC=CAM_ASM_000044 /LENGTH=293 /DNA_ID=CAMNT_0001828909 /DNA_START=1 /DNA_END=879 /DNA_ORIENTATION=+